MFKIFDLFVELLLAFHAIGGFVFIVLLCWFIAHIVKRLAHVK